MRKLRHSMRAWSYVLSAQPGVRDLLKQLQPIIALGFSRLGLSIWLRVVRAILRRVFLVHPLTFWRCWQLEAWTNSLVAILDVKDSGGGDDATVVRLLLSSALDAENVHAFSQYANRTCCYQRTSDSHEFRTGLTPAIVKQLMTEGVLTFCVSYKHTKRSVKEIERDRQRIYNAVKRLATIIAADKLLFWSDVTGMTVGNWAENGIEPYLLVPTVRMVSLPQRDDIRSSFWMSAEKIAAFTRGGLVTINEQTGEIYTNYGNMFMSSFVATIAGARLHLGKALCGPELYYKKSMFEEDKIELLKYALMCVNPKYRRRRNEAGQFSVTGRAETRSFFTEITKGSTEGIVTRPIEHRSNKTGTCWMGHEELLPAVKVLDPQSRRVINEVGKAMSELLVLGTSCAERTVVLIRLLGGVVASTALRLEVQDYEELGDRVVGHVLNYRVASLEEERLMYSSSVVRKQIRFGEAAICREEA